VGPRVFRAAPYGVVAAAVAIAFSPALGGGFLRWDDDRLITENPRVGPPYLENAFRAFGEIRNEAYQPLHVAAYQIDHALWNLHPAGTHAFDLLLYLAAVLLLLRLLIRLGAPPWTAAIGILLFALHPAHVESVAWASGRKDVLSLLLVAGSLLGHVGSRRPFDVRHWGSLALFVAAALTKTTVLFLPLFLPLLDRWVLRRSWREALARAAPAAAAAALLAILVSWIWSDSGLVRPVGPGGSRAALVLGVVGRYVRTVVAPFHLSPLYPIDRAPSFGGAAALGLGAVALLSFAAWWWRRARPAVSAGSALFLLALLPVSNLVPMYFQVNDRYLMIPLLALAFGVWGGAAAFAGRPRIRVGFLAVAALLAVASGIASFVYARAWTGDVALWEAAVARQPRAEYAWVKLGEAYREAGRWDDADRTYARAIALMPDLVPARGQRMLGCLMREVEASGRDPRADRVALLGMAARYQDARRRSDADALFETGLWYYRQRFDECAFRVLLEATEVDPPLSDDRIIGVARDWVMIGRSDRAAMLLDRVSAAGRRLAAYADVRGQAAAGTPYR
jgi:tetratricopeptide (TPR) repeat protein